MQVVALKNKEEFGHSYKQTTMKGKISHEREISASVN